MYFIKRVSNEKHYKCGIVCDLRIKLGQDRNFCKNHWMLKKNIHFLCTNSVLLRSNLNNMRV